MSEPNTRDKEAIKAHRPSSLSEFRMHGVSYEIRHLAPGESFSVSTDVALYFYHVLEGALLAEDENRSMDVGVRDTVVAAGFIPHTITAEENKGASLLIGSEPYEHIAWLRFKPELTCQYASNPHPLQRRILLLLDLIAEEVSDPAFPPDQLTLERMGELLVFYSFRMLNPITGKLDPFPWTDKRLMAAVRALQKAPERDWRVNDLADIANMSASAFSERFVNSIGVSPIRMLTEIRLKSAARKLLQGKTITEVLASSGYGAEESFNRAFKRQFGITPGKWQRQHL